MPSERNEMPLQAHQCTKGFYLTAAHRHFKFQLVQPQNIGIIEPGYDLADFRQIDAVRTVAAKEHLFR